MTKAQKLIIGVPLAAIIVTVALGLYSTRQAERAYQEDINKLRAMGVATNAKQLTANDKGDPGTGEAYQSIISKYQDLGRDRTRLANAFAKWDGTTPKSELQKYREFFQDLYPLIEEVSARPSVSFERDYSQNFALAFPELVEIRAFGHIMSGEARLRAEERDLDGMLVALETLDGLYRHAQSEEGLVSMLMANAIKSQAFKAQAAALQAFQNDSEALNAIQKVIDSTSAQKPLRESLHGEVVAGVEFLESDTSFKDFGGTDPSTPKGLMDHIADLAPIRTSVKRKYVAAWKETYENMPEDENDYEGMMKAMIDVGAKLEADKSIPGRVSSIFFPVFSQSVKVHGATKATDGLAKLGVRLVREGLKTGSYPIDLSEYGELALDPSTGKPFIYRPRKDGFTLYTPGADGTDHGGVKVKGRYQDIVLEISNLKASTPKAKAQ